MSNVPPKRPPTPIPVAHKPQRNVPEVVKEDPTPIDMPLSALIERRTKQTKEHVDVTLSTVQSIRTEQQTMRSELQAYVHRDEIEHNDLKSSMAQKYSELDGKIRVIDTKVDGLDGKLDILVEAVRPLQQVMVHREKVTIEREATHEKIQLEDRADEKKFRRQKWLKIFGILATIATALAAGISGMFGKC